MTDTKARDFGWLKSGIARDNNFDLIRLAAAVQVVFWHGSSHLGAPVSPWFFSFLSFFPGVPIFFFLSGMLVTSSLASSISLPAFYEKRVRRVFPALWLSFAVAVVLLIAFGQLTGQVWRLPSFWLWAATQVSFLQFYNPPYFRHFGTGVVNGSLWTISVEIGFYLVLPFLALAADRMKTARRDPCSILKVMVSCGIALSYVLFAYMAGLGNMAGAEVKAPFWVRLLNQTFLPHFWLFGLGILAYLYYGRLKELLARKGLFLLFLYVLLSFAGDRLGLLALPAPLFASRLLLCATVLALGASSKPVAGRLLHGWDLSYGLYVFHMLVANTLIALHFQGSWLNVFSMLGISLAIAALSWKFVERPAIHQKNRTSKIQVKTAEPRETVAY